MQEIDVLQMTGDRELKAYIYQQLVDVQPFLASDSQLAVMVQAVEPDEDAPVVPRKAEAAPVEPEKPVKKKKARKKAAADVAKTEAEEETPTRDLSDYLVTLVATFEEGRLETEGQAADIYDAFSIAKEKMVAQLSEWQNATISSQERAMQIQTIMSGNYMIH